MESALFDERWLDVFGDTCARLSTRFSDRSAVLWRAGFDEDTWARFEASCVRALKAEEASGGSRLAVRFSRKFSSVCQALFDVPLPPAFAPASKATEAVHRADEGAAITSVQRAGSTSDREPLDPLDAMTTLASPTKGAAGEGRS